MYEDNNCGEIFRPLLEKATNVTKPGDDFSPAVTALGVAASTEAHAGPCPVPTEKEQLWSWMDGDAAEHCVGSSTL